MASLIQNVEDTKKIASEAAEAALKAAKLPDRSDRKQTVIVGGLEIEIDLDFDCGQIGLALVGCDQSKDIEINLVSGVQTFTYKDASMLAGMLYQANNQD